MMPVRPKRRSALLIVVSAPSGAGKTTLCGRLLAERKDIVYSVSCTTRPRRGREVDGEDYFFLSDEEFERRVREGEFLEHATVHGYRYGTLRKTVDDALRRGRSILMDIDVQGAAQVRRRLREQEQAGVGRVAWVDLFIAPPSMEALRERLERRGENGAQAIAQRLRAAAEEMRRSRAFRHVLVNDDIERTYAELVSILDREQEMAGGGRTRRGRTNRRRRGEAGQEP